jgi:formylmethanofuran dehydrogenase subunit B
MTAPRSVLEPVTCLGCGCVCDDVSVQLSQGRIVGVLPDCPAARAWFGDGSVPERVLRSGAEAGLDDAVAEAASLLAGSAGRLLVYLGPDLSTQAQRTVVALADVLRARVDSATSEPAAQGLLSAQRRGRASATLGEIRNRADVLLFWGVDPAARYPRYLSRYALEPEGTHVTGGRRGRKVISIHIGNARSPAAAEMEVTLDPADEIAALSVMRATVLGNRPAGLSPALESAAGAAEEMLRARYAVLVHEAEPGALARDAFRAEGLIALVQALNGPTRAALSSLRAGGNRSGAESVLTWQTGYPLAVDFSTGVPRYAPSVRGLATVGNGAAAAVLIAGSAGGLDADTAAALGGLPTVVIGPRASEAPFAARVAIDTGVAGIHEAGTAYRMDEMPLPLHPPLAGRRTAAATLGSLLAAVQARLRKKSA